jgi:hypothetical protein
MAETSNDHELAGNLSDAEVDLLLQQLIDQHGGERPPDAEAHALIRWAEHVRIDQQLLDMVLAGDAEVRLEGGTPSFRLTEKGMAQAEALLRESPAARVLHDELVAQNLKRPLTPGP